MMVTWRSFSYRSNKNLRKHIKLDRFNIKQMCLHFCFSVEISSNISISSSLRRASFFMRPNTLSASSSWTNKSRLELIILLMISVIREIFSYTVRDSLGQVKLIYSCCHCPDGIIFYYLSCDFYYTSGSEQSSCAVV